MSSGLTIPPIATLPIGRAEAETRHAATFVSPPQPQATPAGTPNPTYRLDPALGLVVMQFREDDQTQSVPTQQQLEAYRSGAATPPGEAKPPAGEHGGTAD